MIFETVTHKESGSIIKMPITADGYSLCPVCGVKAQNKEFRPYDSQGFPSYGICLCGIEFGFECSADSTQEAWSAYRTKWFNEELQFGNSRTLSKQKKIEQLLTIDIRMS